MELNNDLDLKAAGLFEGLLLTALKGEHHKFEFIRDLSMRKACRCYKRGLKKVLKFFKTAQKLYERSIAEGRAGLLDIMLAEQIKICVQYYQKELNIVRDMLNEYHFYMWDGHNVIASYLGKQRTALEMFDYRKM